MSEIEKTNPADTSVNHSDKIIRTDKPEIKTERKNSSVAVVKNSPKANPSDAGVKNSVKADPSGTPDRRVARGWKFWLTWLMRLTVGGTFIFSGFIKGIDPWGTIFKISDYLSAMGISVWPTLVNTGAIALCILEFMIGIFIFLGCFRRSAPIVGLCVMAVMLPLSGWIMFTHPVSDCGCFGDFLIISDSATFLKNVVLTFGFIWLLKFNRHVSCLITPYLQWVCFVVSALFLCVIAEIGYLYQPLLDFRPFGAGQPLADTETLGESEEEEYEFVYRKGDEEKIVGEQDVLPSESEGWVFIEARPKNAIKGSQMSQVKGSIFRIWDGDEDVTNEVAIGEGPKLWLMMPRLGDVSIAETWKINTIKDWCEKHGVDFVAVVNGTPEEIAEWKDLSLADYPVYTAEDTLIKEVVRGKVALVYTLDGDIQWKSTLQTAWRPGFEDDSLSDLEELRHDNISMLRNIWMLYLAVILVLVAASRFKPVFRGFKRTPKRSLRF